MSHPRQHASGGAIGHTPALAVVTGASSGIGEATARLLAARGCRTVLIARDGDALRRLADALSTHAPSRAFPLDLSDVDAVAPALAEIVAREGPVSVLVNNAGYNDFKPFLAGSAAEHERLLNVNYVAVARLIHTALPGMIELAAAGAAPHVINISSMSAKIGPWGHAAYAAAKSALTTLTHALDAEYGPSGVRFGVIHPGLVRTRFFDQGDYPRLLHKFRRDAVTPERVARAVVRMLDRPRLDVCVPAHYRLLDLLIALAPASTHRAVASKSRLDNAASPPGVDPATAAPGDARTPTAGPRTDAADRAAFSRLPARGPQTSRADRA